jgi:hypothetical protein
MKITDWFDPNDKSHLEAYEHLKNGVWPKDFIPNDMDMLDKVKVTKVI